MPVDRTPGTYSSAEVKTVFDVCKKNEEAWLLPQRPKDVAREWLFSEPKFVSPTGAEPVAWMNVYKELVEQLKTADDVMLWFWLGLWFKAESIRDPIQIFPAKSLNRLTQRMDISGADIHNAGIVRIWLPYTEPLVRRTKWLRQEGDKESRNALRKLGYDSAAVGLVTSKAWDSEVEFTCDWVASRTLESSRERQRETLVNSYSRFRKKWWLNVNRCSFCRERAEGEFWVREEPIPYCEEHKPDKLPKSQNESWPDRAGRRWWRQNLDIRCMVPSAST